MRQHAESLNIFLKVELSCQSVPIEQTPFEEELKRTPGEGLTEKPSK
jgi:hypothetical protein